MQKSVRRFVILACSLFLTLGSLTYGQSNPNDQPSAPPAKAKADSDESSARVGIGVKGSLLGGGVEVAARVTRHTNVRAGFNIISYSRDFNKDGITYNGTLGFKTVEAHYDIFPFAGNFHVSPGVLAYIGDPITASAAVAGGQSFTLGGTTYYSDTTTPVTGNGKIDFNRAAPMATIGWGNLVPRRHNKHFSVPFELGVAFQGSPKATLSLGGNVCDSPGVNCRPAATDTGVQTNVQSEQTKLNNSMSFFKAYPIISVGFGYAF
ncbi:MAG TPA: hypothetical protein VK812_19455 [Candidatus Binatus sp.]|nr:hypothetical protein [Candidatus Binatus sp.]